MTRISTFLTLSFFTRVIFTLEVSTGPVVGNWQDAVASDGLVRIPLQNPKGHVWFASL